MSVCVSACLCACVFVRLCASVHLCVCAPVFLVFARLLCLPGTTKKNEGRKDMNKKERAAREKKNESGKNENRKKRRGAKTNRELRKTEAESKAEGGCIMLSRAHRRLGVVQERSLPTSLDQYINFSFVRLGGAFAESSAVRGFNEFIAIPIARHHCLVCVLGFCSPN